jgi:hypothetical protein
VPDQLAFEIYGNQRKKVKTPKGAQREEVQGNIQGVKIV